MRAKKIQNKPVVNEVVSDAVEVKRMKKKIAALEAQLKQNKNQIVKYQQMQNELDFLKRYTIKSEDQSSDQSSGAKKAARRQTWCCVGGQSMIPLHVDSTQYKTGKNIAANEQGDSASNDLIEGEWNDEEMASINENATDSTSTFKVPTKLPPVKRSLLAVPTSFKSPIHRANCMLQKSKQFYDIEITIRLFFIEISLQ